MAHHDDPERPRANLWMILGLTVWAAVACITTRMIRAYRQAPYTAALKDERAWVVQPASQFVWRLDPAGNKMTPSGHQFLAKPTTSPCLLKMAWITGLDPETGARFTVKKAISAEGYCESRYWEPRAVKGGITDLDAAQFARLRTILKGMPVAPKSVDPRDVLLVGYVDPRGRWTTARYDFRHVPREIREIGDLLRWPFP